VLTTQGNSAHALGASDSAKFEVCVVVNAFCLFVGFLDEVDDFSLGEVLLEFPLS
jgi:hypothetical protein